LGGFGGAGYVDAWLKGKIDAIPMLDPGTALSRRRDLDVARELIVGSLIFFHTARIFDGLGFYVKNEPPERALTFVVALTSLWGMPLMFAIAGFGIWHSLQKRTVYEFVQERVQRLLIPFIFGLLVVVPPQIYFRLMANPTYHEAYAQFYPKFFDIRLQMEFPWFVSADPSTDLFQPGHMWFLYVLLVFTLLLLPVFVYLRSAAGRRIVSRAAVGTSRPWAVFLPAIPIAALEAGLGTDMSGGWNQSAYVVFLLYGYLLAADQRFGQVLCRYWKIGLGVAVVGSIGGIFGFAAVAESAGSDPLHAYDLASVTLRVVKGAVGWSWMVAILGFLEYRRTKRQIARPREAASAAPSRTILARVERYANEAVLPFYMLHQTAIVAIGFYVVKWHTGTALKFLVISLSALAVTLLLYEVVVRRTRLTRFLFGMKSAAAAGLESGPRC
jgi:hypothetical protein